MHKKIFAKTAIAAIFLSGSVYAQSARDNLEIVGSSTVYPFAVAVAEQFSEKTDFAAPNIKSNGTGEGMKLFCAGVGPEFPDIANASRSLKTSELEVCSLNGVVSIIELPVGYDGIVVAGSEQMEALKISRGDLYNAISARIPDPNGGEKVIRNPHRTWQDVNPALPDLPIEVILPPKGSGTLDAVRELVMEPACTESELVKELKDTSIIGYEAACHAFRRDSVYADIEENNEDIIKSLQSKPNALAIVSYSALQNHEDELQGMPVDGVMPTFEGIAAGEYPLSRPLFLYVKQAHWDVIPGMEEYIAEFISEQAAGPNGYLISKSLVPLGEQERAANRAKVDKQKQVAAN